MAPPVLRISAVRAKTCSRVIAALLAIAYGVVPAADAADDLAFARSKKCMNCHGMTDKLVGPAYQAVASRYANDREAEVRLARKIREGSSGAWGNVPMPPNPAVTTDEAQRLARWVLMQK